MAATIPELPLLSLSDDELNLVTALRTDLMEHRFKLELLDSYFNGNQLVRDLGISIPPQLKGLHTVIGWPRIGVETLEQRLDLEAFRWADGGDAEDLREIAQANDLFEESSLAHLDALTYGREYVAVGTGDDEAPLITAESPLDMTLFWDARARVATSALRESVEDGVRVITLYLPGETIHAAEMKSGWEVLDRDPHMLGVVPVVRMANRQRTADRVGKSEITPEVMSITDAACRRLMGIEVAAEFFGAPARYILGASESAFQDADGNPKAAWETYLGRVLALEADEEGNVPQVGQFAAHDPTGMTKIIDLYARIMATQLGLPPHMLGYTSDNPASADAIRSSEAMLVKKAERRTRRFGGAWSDVMRLALWVRDGAPPERSRRIECVWRDPSTPTVAQQTDAVVKLVQQGILPADSEVALEMAGLSEDQRQRVMAERRRAQGAANSGKLLDRLAQLGDGEEPAAEPEGLSDADAGL